MWINLSLAGLPGGQTFDAIERLIDKAFEEGEESTFQEEIDQVK